MEKHAKLIAIPIRYCDHPGCVEMAKKELLDYRGAHVANLCYQHADSALTQQFEYDQRRATENALLELGLNR